MSIFMCALLMQQILTECLSKTLTQFTARSEITFKKPVLNINKLYSACFIINAYCHTNYSNILILPAKLVNRHILFMYS